MKWKVAYEGETHRRKTTMCDLLKELPRSKFPRMWELAFKSHFKSFDIFHGLSSEFRSSMNSTEQNPARHVHSETMNYANGMLLFELGPRVFHLYREWSWSIFEIYFINRFSSINFNLRPNAFGNTRSLRKPFAPTTQSVGAAKNMQEGGKHVRFPLCD